MDNLQKIDVTIPQTIEFELDVVGTDDSKPSVRFCIKTDKLSVVVDCKSADGKYVAELPSLNFLPLGEHACQIEVIADGHLFIPLESKIVLIEPAPVEESTEQPEEPIEVTDFTPIVMNPLPEDKKQAVREAIRNLIAKRLNSQNKDLKVKEIIASINDKKD